MKLETADTIARSRRADIYLGVVAPMGIGLQTFQDPLRELLSAFGYDLEVLRLSVLMQDVEGIEIDASTPELRIETSMAAGCPTRGKGSTRWSTSSVGKWLRSCGAGSRHLRSRSL